MAFEFHSNAKYSEKLGMLIIGKSIILRKRIIISMNKYETYSSLRIYFNLALEQIFHDFLFSKQWRIQNFGRERRHFSEEGAVIGKNDILRFIRGNINTFFVHFCWEKSKKISWTKGRSSRRHFLKIRYCFELIATENTNFQCVRLESKKDF